MKKKSDTDKESFKALLEDAQIKPLEQDKHFFKRQSSVKKAVSSVERAEQEVSFSDGYQPHLPEEGVMRYSRDQDKRLVKQLRRGDFAPEATLDVHGLTQEQAKKEIISGLAEAVEQKMVCICLTHGHGGGTLKRQVPFWLVQHPHVLAFHEAPQRMGGNGTLLVLLDTLFDDEHKDKSFKD